MVREIKEKILKELFRREKGGWWELEGRINPFVTAGALYLLHERKIWKSGWEKTVRKLIEDSRSLDLESLRMVLIFGSKLKMNLENVNKRLYELFDGDKNLWRVYDGSSGDPLTSSAMLIAMRLVNHEHPLKEKVLEGILHNENLPGDLANFIGGQRPVLTSLYRALALSLHGRKEGAKRIWEKVKKAELVDLPAQISPRKGIKGRWDLSDPVGCGSITHTRGRSLSLS